MSECQRANAVEKNNLKRVTALLDAGVPVDRPCSHSQTPLSYAAEKDNRRMVELLLGRGARANVTFRFGTYSPLMCAVLGGHLSIVRLLIKRGADVNLIGSPGLTALMGAGDYGDTRIAALLIASGANVNAQDRAGGGTALMRAIYHRKHDCIKLLLAHGADKSLRNHAGETALTIARQNKDHKAMNLLGD